MPQCTHTCLNTSMLRRVKKTHMPEAWIWRPCCEFLTGFKLQQINESRPGGIGLRFALTGNPSRLRYIWNVFTFQMLRPPARGANRWPLSLESSRPASCDLLPLWLAHLEACRETDDWVAAWQKKHHLLRDVLFACRSVNVKLLDYEYLRRRVGQQCVLNCSEVYSLREGKREV